MDRVVANAAVRVAGLVKRFGKREALAGVDLEVAPGEAFGLVGANGAGKTTLLKCMLDLCAFDAGRIEIFGVTSGEARARARLAYVPERFLPPHYLRGREFLELTVRLGGRAYDEAAARTLLAELALEAEALERPVRELSKGMMQKLGLAAGFLLGRELTVLDEPMSGLDPASRLAVKSVLARVRAEGRTLLFTSHVLADVEELCTGIAVLERGRVRFRGAARAQVIVVTRRRVPAKEAQALASRLAGRLPGVLVATAHLGLSGLEGMRSGRPVAAGALSGKRVIAAAGIADPSSFAVQVRASGARVQLLAYQDHHAYADGDVARLLRAAREEADYLVVTEKDAVKLRHRWPADAPEPLVAVLTVTWETNGDQLTRTLDRVPAGKPPTP